MWFYTICILSLLSDFLQAQILVVNPDNVVTLAHTQSIMMQSSAYAVKGKDAEKKKAFTAFLPKLKGNASYTHLDEAPVMQSAGIDASGISITDSVTLKILGVLSQLFSSEPTRLSPQEIWRFGFSVQQPIFTGGKILYGYRISDYALKAAQKEHTATSKNAQRLALQLFWAYVSSLEKLATVKENRIWLENRVNNLQISYKNGIIIEHTLLKSKVALSGAQLQELRTANEKKAVEESLLLFLNLPLSTELRLDTEEKLFTHTSHLPPPSKQFMDSVIENRDDIQKMETNIEMVQLSKKVFRGNYLPNVFASYNHLFSNERSSDESELEGSWNVGVGLEWNIFDWGAVYRDIQSASYHTEQLQLAKKAKSDEIRTKILDAYRKVTEAKEGLIIATEGVRNAQKSLEIAEIQYNEGVITDVELLEARKDLTEAKSNLIYAKVGKELAIVEYNFAVNN